MSMLRVPHLKRYRPGAENDIAPPSQEALSFSFKWFAALDAYHRYRIEGLEHVPRSGPGLIVSHHSYIVIDTMLLFRRIYLRDGRIPRSLTDHAMFKIPVIRDLFYTWGVLDGTPENGLRVLADGQLALVMPGGGLEWSRPSTQAQSLRWGEHRGYARLAIRAGVPIIPTACPSADHLYIVPFDAWKVAKTLEQWLGMHRIPPMPIGFGLGPLPFPVRLTQYVAPPILPDVSPEAADDEVAVKRLDDRVREAITELLHRRSPAGS
ncbi:MAG: acyltransferase family protein [Deltaproteobacteria bacterium]|nr:acyltransferase family protein [Deltaproteobacteria bacterium]